MTFSRVKRKSYLNETFHMGEKEWVVAKKGRVSWDPILARNMPLRLWRCIGSMAVASDHVQAFFPYGSNTLFYLSSGGQHGYRNALV
ncbi:MAG: hypothetical protein A2Z14_00800 [Chloroflexi bacterium RBG_16_48_8]|nr:MAG: hypothetical protein A2Z14_00800 [Chloroflexi bacterium RBG_16_48_8]